MHLLDGEYLPAMGGNPFMLYVYIFRMTIGFSGRKSWAMSETDITKAIGIKKPKSQREKLIQLGLINAEHVNGTKYIYTIVEFWLKPLQKMEGGVQQLDASPPKTGCLPSKNKSATPTKIVGGSRGAIDSNIDNYIDSNIEDDFIVFKTAFKKHTPPEKWDEEVAYEIFLQLNNKDRESVFDALPYQNNAWSKPDFNHKYTPKASNYLLKRCFLEKEIQSSVRREKARIKKEIEYRKYIKLNEENAASQEDIREIMEEGKRCLNESTKENQ